MKFTHWLAGSAAILIAGTGISAQAGLLDRLAESSQDRAKPDDERSSISFAVASNDDIGKVVMTAHQTLAAPGAGPATPPPRPAGPATTSPPPAAPSSSFNQPPPMSAPAQPFPKAGPPIPAGPQGPPVAGPGAYSAGPPSLPVGGPLFSRVEIEDPDHIHPCAVPTVVQVLDPNRHECGSCGPRCVYVQIYAPPGRPEIKVRRNGRKVKYDYGDYKVVVKSHRDGHIEVDYDD